MLDLASLGSHGVARQELRHRSSDGLGTLDVQEMADTFDGAILDLWEPGVDQGPAFDEQLHRLGAEDREDRLEDGGGLLGTERPGADGWEFDAEEGVGVLDRLGSGPNAQALMAGSSMPKRVSTSLTVWAMPPGTCSSMTAWQVSQSSPLTAFRNPATARSWSPAP